MAHSKQAEKRHRQNLKARARNKVQRSAMKSALKKATKSASKETLPEAMHRIDKAAKRRVIHPNAAARLKSRLAKKLAAAAK